MRKVLIVVMLSAALATSCSMVDDEEVVDESIDSTSEEGMVLVPGCDQDGDGWQAVTCGGQDCDDDDPEVHPGHVSPDPETCMDGVDNDCDGVTDDPGECEAGCTSPECRLPVCEPPTCG